MRPTEENPRPSEKLGQATLESKMKAVAWASPPGLLAPEGPAHATEETIAAEIAVDGRRRELLLVLECGRTKHSLRIKKVKNSRLREVGATLVI